MKIKKASSIGILVLSIIFLAGIASAFSYQSTINFSAPTPVTNYQVSIILNPSNFNYSLAKANGADLRFFDNANNSLSYFIESWNSGGTSSIWVKIPVAGTNSIIMKFGNSSLSSNSNAANTFVFYDDFSGGLDSNKWSTHTARGSVNVVSGELVETTSTNGVTWGANAYTNTNLNLANEGYVITAQYRYPQTYCDTNGPYIALVDKDNVKFSPQTYYDYPDVFSIVEDIKSGANSGHNSIPVNNCTLKITLYNQTSYKIESIAGDCTTYSPKYPFNTILPIEYNYGAFTPNSINLGIAEYSGAGQNCPSASINPIYWNSIGVRKFVGPGDINAVVNPSTPIIPDSTNNSPVISNINISNITNSSATINWNTDINSNSIVNYGLNTSLGLRAYPYRRIIL